MVGVAGSGWDAAALTALRADLAHFAPAGDDGERVDRIRALEELKSAVAAAQAVETAEFVASQRAAQAAAGVPVRRQGRGVAGQVALAKRMSPHAAERYTGWAGILTRELPHTLQALRDGRTTEWRAMIAARETAWLSREHRAQIDRDLGPQLHGWGDRRVEAEVKAAAYRLDPYGYVQRTRNAETDRRVTVRPAPDVMARLTALLPVAQAVAAYAALRQHADTTIATGDARSRGQVMADTLVERLTGQANAGDVAVEINLVMTDTALFPDTAATQAGGTAADAGDTAAHAGDTVPDEAGETAADAGDTAAHAGDTAGETAADAGDTAAHAGDTAGDAGQTAADAGDPAPAHMSTTPNTRTSGAEEPAVLLGYGPVPAQWARDLIRASSDTTPMWLRRLYRDPITGELAAMDSRRRCFTPNQRHFLRIRDGDTCRTPWCGAPLRHHDHVRAVEHGGPTSVNNAQGTCAACNYTKQAPGWTADAAPDGTIRLVTPTGHTYTHQPPTLTGSWSVAS